MANRSMLHVLAYMPYGHDNQVVVYMAIACAVANDQQ